MDSHSTFAHRSRKIMAGSILVKKHSTQSEWSVVGHLNSERSETDLVIFALALFVISLFLNCLSSVCQVLGGILLIFNTVQPWYGQHTVCFMAEMLIQDMNARNHLHIKTPAYWQFKGRNVMSI